MWYAATNPCLLEDGDPDGAGQLSARPSPTTNQAHRRDWVLHPTRTDCPGFSSLLTDLGRGTSVGDEADLGWLLDGDDDGMPDAWEDFWFGTDATCSDLAAYWSGLPPVGDAEVCAHPPPDETCP